MPRKVSETTNAPVGTESPNNSINKLCLGPKGFGSPEGKPLLSRGAKASGSYTSTAFFKARTASGWSGVPSKIMMAFQREDVCCQTTTEDDFGKLRPNLASNCKIPSKMPVNPSKPAECGQHHERCATDRKCATGNQLYCSLHLNPQNQKGLVFNPWHRLGRQHAPTC